MTELFRTRFEPFPDITAYELALDMKFINQSQIVADYNFEALGTALRHRVCTQFEPDEAGRQFYEMRMDRVAKQLSVQGDGKNG